LEVTLTTAGTTFDEAAMITDLEAAFEPIACADVPNTQSCDVKVVSLNGNTVRARARQLQTTSTLVAELEVILEAICFSTDCEDPTAIQTIANTVYDSVEGDVLEAINNGSLVSTLQSSSADAATLLANAVASADFSEAVVSLLALLNEFYPDWQTQSGKCLNDGNAPVYMQKGNYIESTLDACCERWFSWDIATCKGGSTDVVSGFYPNWGNNDVKCLDAADTSNTVPGYMRSDPSKWLYDTIESCCERYYGWDYDTCVVGSGGSSATTSTETWYVNQKDEICQQDCPTSAGATCGGNAKKWDTLYPTVESCCENKLGYISSSVCVAQSTGGTAVGTGYWYTDWVAQKCVKDCETGSDPDCGGLASAWDKLDAQLSVCCSRLFWVDASECTN